MSEAETETFLAARLAAFRDLSFAEASMLPEAASDDTTIARHRYAVTTFRELVRLDEVMVTVQLARQVWFGLRSVHVEKGIVFHRDGTMRDALPHELTVYGG